MQGMWEASTLAQIILWSHIEYAWHTIWSFLMNFTRRWRSMCVLDLQICHLSLSSILFSILNFSPYSCYYFLGFYVVTTQGISSGTCSVSFSRLEFLHQIMPDTQHFFIKKLVKCKACALYMTIGMIKSRPRFLNVLILLLFGIPRSLM